VFFLKPRKIYCFFFSNSN